MTTIAQLPLAAEVGSNDLIPISQQGTLYAATVGQVISGLQTTITLPTGDLLGRISAGAGSPEAINLGLGLSLVSGSIAATGSDHAGFPVQATMSLTDKIVITTTDQPALLEITALRNLFNAGAGITIDSNGLISADIASFAGPAGPQGPVGPAGLQGPSGSQGAQGAGLAAPSASSLANFIGANDYIAIWQNGTNNWITYQQLIGGQTIDQLPSAGPAQDSDQILVAQGTNSLSSQSFSAIWTYVSKKLLTIKTSIVDLASNTVLDGTNHNGRILVISQPLTLTANYTNMGSGFSCRIINLSSGVVSMGTGITASNGVNLLPSGSEAVLTGITYSGGSIVWWSGTKSTSPSLTISLVPPLIVSTPFTISGDFYNDTVTSLDYSFDQTTWIAAPSPTIASSSYSFLVPGVAAGNYVIYVRDHLNQSVTAASNSFEVVNPNVSFNSVPSSASIETPILVAGAVTPSNAAVQVGLSLSSSTSPTSFILATSASGAWTASIAPQATGTIYVWAQQVDNSSVIAVSSAISVNGVALSVNTPASGNVGTTFEITGTVTSQNPAVTVQFSSQNITAPTSSGVLATISGDAFSAGLISTNAGTFYVWAQDQAAGLVAVSGAVVVAAQSTITYTVNQPSVTSYTHGSGTIAINGSVNPPQSVATQITTSTNNTTAPVSGWQPASIIDNNSLWASYVNTPAESGSYYIWVQTTGGTATVVSSFALTIT